MPRIKPLSEQELAIAKRVESLRLLAHISRERLGSDTSLGLGGITRIELGRIPLLYNAAVHIMQCAVPVSRILGMSVNPLWLAFGTLPTYLEWPLKLPFAEMLGESPKLNFLTFAERERKLLEALTADPPRPVLPLNWLQTYAAAIKSFRAVEGDRMRARLVLECLFIKSVQKLEAESNDTSGILGTMVTWAEKFQRPEMSFDTLLQKELEKPIDKVTQESYFSPMQSEIKRLVARLKKATEETGKKAELARFLNVPKQRISEWLSERKEPSGETALQLLQWVQKQEANK